MPSEAARQADLPFEPAEEGGAGTVFQCGLCGARFTHGGQVCGGCPLRAACNVVQCPNCGYQFPRSSHIVRWLRWLWTAEEEEEP